MTRECVCEVASKYGIDISDVRININKARIGCRGSTAPDTTITLTRRPFDNEEQLARTLAHERFHVDQLRSGMGYPKVYDAFNEWETQAEQFENEWWKNHPVNRLRESNVVSRQPGSYEDWVDQYEKLYRAPDAVQDLGCPNCGSRTLKLVFVVDADHDESATEAFWCATCHQGIALAPCDVPVGAERHLRKEVHIPSYSLVLP